VHYLVNTLFISFLWICAFFILGFSVPQYSYAQADAGDVIERRAELENELAGIEKEIDAQQAILQVKQRETVSLERDVAILDARIQSSELSIRAREIEIGNLASDISGKEDKLDVLSEKLDRERESLAQLIRKTRELDNFSIVEVILANKNLSEFFKDLDDFTSIKSALQDSFVALESTQKQTRTEKSFLEDKRSEEEELRGLQVLQKRRIESDKGEKASILEVTRGEEEKYQKVIREKEKDAAAIRTELFVLRGTDAIPFERALGIANVVSTESGVRPALILGVIAEESNLGANVGTGNWKIDMHPTRDRPIFEEITRRLGLDPDAMPVSKKPWYGWGGAMGPAQFIPSTWVLYENKVADLTGHRPPNPWDPYDAFMASGVLLRDNGAAKGGYQNERLAALRYFAGWKNATKPAYSFYGDEVMALTAKYQRQIDILQGN
jgi:peptidoglycan hydrolase CwlO-like protein